MTFLRGCEDANESISNWKVVRTGEANGNIFPRDVWSWKKGSKSASKTFQISTKRQHMGNGFDVKTSHIDGYSSSHFGGRIKFQTEQTTAHRSWNGFVNFYVDSMSRWQWNIWECLNLRQPYDVASREDLFVSPYKLTKMLMNIKPLAPRQTSHPPTNLLATLTFLGKPPSNNSLRCVLSTAAHPFHMNFLRGFVCVIAGRLSRLRSSTTQANIEDTKHWRRVTKEN